MVKIQDGSLITVNDLLSGAEDDDGNKLTFVKNESAFIPTFKAESIMGDGSGRKKIYSFDLVDTPVRVSVSTVEPEPEPESEEPATDDKDKDKPKAATEARIVNTDIPPQHQAMTTKKK
jgi:hypothetical protein